MDTLSNVSAPAVGAHSNTLIRNLYFGLITSCMHQVDGAYEDWVEMLRLMYYSGTSLCRSTRTAMPMFRLL